MIGNYSSGTVVPPEINISVSIDQTLTVNAVGIAIPPSNLKVHLDRLLIIQSQNLRTSDAWHLSHEVEEEAGKHGGPSRECHKVLAEGRGE